jgi:hypothetical protein
MLKKTVLGNLTEDERKELQEIWATFEGLNVCVAQTQSRRQAILLNIGQRLQIMDEQWSADWGSGEVFMLEKEEPKLIIPGGRKGH